MPTEHNIRCTGEEVRAILDGQKTMTRRVVKPQPIHSDEPWPNGKSCLTWDDVIADPNYYVACGHCPYGKPGDLLWVRETWGSKEADRPLCPDGRKPQCGDSIVYRANPADDYQWGAGKASQGSFVWRPSIHMPRWASRITLEVTDVRVERVQDISEGDVLKEGCELHSHVGANGPACPCAFVGLWDSLNAKRGYSWESNPYTWVVEFKQVEVTDAKQD